MQDFNANGESAEFSSPIHTDDGDFLRVYTGNARQKKKFNAEPLVRLARLSARSWKRIALPIVLGIACGLAVFVAYTSSPITNPPEAPVVSGKTLQASQRASSPYGVPLTSEPSNSSTASRAVPSGETSTQTDEEVKRVLERNRRLEALVAILRQRKEAKSVDARPISDVTQWRSDR